MHVRVAVAAGLPAQREGVARFERSRGQLSDEATRAIGTVREATALLAREGLIQEPPDELATPPA